MELEPVPGLVQRWQCVYRARGVDNVSMPMVQGWLIYLHALISSCVCGRWQVDEFILPVIQGFASINPGCTLGQAKFDYVLLSRRAIHRAGRGAWSFVSVGVPSHFLAQLDETRHMCVYMCVRESEREGGREGKGKREGKRKRKRKKKRKRQRRRKRRKQKMRRRRRSR